nr:MAG TPA: hypothetical protein [Caudoviricetes sp.]
METSGHFLASWGRAAPLVSPGWVRSAGLHPHASAIPQFMGPLLCHATR